MQPVYVVTDSDGHWYVIPITLILEFYNIEDENLFIEKFGKYRTGGDINLVQLYAEL